MPDYVEETGQPHSIQGAPTSTTGFLGPTHSGPLILPAAPLTSLVEFEEIYGGPAAMQFEDASQTPNVMWHAARAFFENGGTHLYVSRVFRPGTSCNSDGRRPTAADYAGNFDSTTNRQTGLKAFEDVLYYPWVTIHDPLTGSFLNLPPSGFVAGIYARNDLAGGVSKAPANEVINLATGLETILDDTQQEILNPLGINTLRFFEGRGYRVWGARTISSDPEWKYVAIRRYFAYLEHSIDNGTQWVVFEPNGDDLWENVRQIVSDFLFNEWSSGALMGSKPDEAYFVKCDRSTMTQHDIDNGRLIILIGVAPLHPAEFVIFRIGQWTADHKVKRR